MKRREFIAALGVDGHCESGCYYGRLLADAPGHSTRAVAARRNSPHLGNA
jgi:hypothetical protein